MKKIVYSFLLCIAFLQGKATTLFEYLGSNPQILNNNQLATFSTFEDAEVYTNYYFAQGQDLYEVLNNGEVELNLPFLSETTLIYTVRNQYYKSAQNYTWYGLDRNTINETNSTIEYTNVNGSITGYIRYKDKEIDFRSIGDGVIVFGLSNPAYAENSKCEVGINSTENNIVSNNNNSEPTDLLGSCTRLRLKVLVLFSNYNNSLTGSLLNNPNLRLSYATGYINSANNVRHNSNFNLEPLELAGAEMLMGFSKSSIIDDDMDLLTNPTSGQNNTLPNDIETMRLAAQADVVVVIVKDKYNDWDFTVFPPQNNATLGATNTQGGTLAIVNRNTAISKLTFAHEIHHMFGAGHEEQPGVAIDAHAFNLFGKVTTMFSVTNGLQLNPFLSNSKNYDFQGHITGVPIMNNKGRENVKEILNKEQFVASRYLDNTPIPFTAKMKAFDFGLCDHNGSAILNIFCGNPPYTIEWQESIDGVNWVNKGTVIAAPNNSANLASVNYPNWSLYGNYSSMFSTLRAKITDANGQQITEEIKQSNVCPGKIESNPPFYSSGKATLSKAKFQVDISPTPTTSHLNISIKNATDQVTHVIIKDIFGNTRFNKNYNTNNTNFTIQEQSITNTLVSGIYIIQIKNNQDVYTQKIIIQ